MPAYLFLKFPDEDNILDANDVVEDVRRVFREIYFVKNNLRTECIDFAFCYDSENLQQYLKAVMTLDETDKVVGKANQLKALLSGNSIDVAHFDKSQCDSVYALWDVLTEAKIDFEVSRLYKNLCHYGNPGMYSFCKTETGNTELDIIEDAIHKPELPELVKVPFFVCADDCLDWINTFKDGSFHLFANPKFSSTHFRWGNQSIYLNKDTGKYWYFDFFHNQNGRPHYEVFNDDGTHDGESDLNGNPIPNSRDASKSISHLIHGR